MTAVIRTDGLTKRYGRLTVVDDVGLDVPPGEVFGFLGPNGSGKTTTIRMLLGLVAPTAGRVELLGRPMPGGAQRSRSPRSAPWSRGPASTPACPGAGTWSSSTPPGRAAAASTRRRRIADVLERVGLGGVDRRPVKAYSMGMRQRLGLAAALMRQPRLLVLDEPTNGLDPQGIREMRHAARRSWPPRAPRCSCRATCSARSRRSAPAPR